MRKNLIAATLRDGGRVLLAGAPGTGKSSTAAALAAELAEASVRVACLGCDPGSPAFGVPGAVCLGEWRAGGWALVDLEPVCSLDPARFRLPLIQAVSRVLERAPRAALLIDPPGAVRGVAGAELLTALAAASRADLVVLLERRGSTVELEQEIAALTVPVLRLPASAQAHCPSKRARALRRTELWDAYLTAGAIESPVDIERLAVVGTPPPADAPGGWPGRQIALIRGRDCVGFGEIAAAEGRRLVARVRGTPDGASTLLIRDARRARDGLLGTAKALPRGGPAVVATEPPSAGASDERGTEASADLRIGPFTATLVNGVFGDPLLRVRLPQGGRTLLFDLGETNRLGARVAHQVTDVFITHAHVDHIGGFMWLLRSRIGEFSACRLYGPPGLAANVSGLVNGVHWDRAGEGAPRFEVTELHEDGRALGFTVKAGEIGARATEERRARGGTLLDEPPLRVRAIMLDHRTPVLAFALESAGEANVLQDRLARFDVPAGPWLARLKHEVAAGRWNTAIELPDGSERSVTSLADALIVMRPSTKIVYATDLADTAENRRKLTEFARGADALFCESTFREAEAEKAERTGHLTTRACGEMAVAAGVERLVPFHFSRRYESDREAVYRELQAVCRRTLVPSPGTRR
ncbi:MAG: MBL fold metallo-hydrolase [Gammaproteobacteria bacterium]|nr:MBL fold metallo-hydrolase [Gammaproteobacteria bacterium]